MYSQTHLIAHNQLTVFELIGSNGTYVRPAASKSFAISAIDIHSVAPLSFIPGHVLLLSIREVAIAVCIWEISFLRATSR